MGKKIDKYWRSSPCMQHPSRKKTSHNNWVWVPAVPSWEKEFCYKIGLFKWESFLEAKKLTGFFTHNNILEWNDSEAEEAFHRAKNRFFAKIMNNQLPGPDDDHNESIPGPDLYIDEIDWDHDHEEIINTGHGPDGLEFAAGDNNSSDEEGEDANVVINTDYNVPDYSHVRIEDIKPTGWDIDVQEFSTGRVLTGLIVGR